MANTYSQISIHAVFAVKYREGVLHETIQEELFKYIHGIIENVGCKSLAVGGWTDHVHIFFGLPVTHSISDVVGQVKSNSSRWINENQLKKGRFEWQLGFGAFSHSMTHRDRVIKYIMNQKQHHQTKTFREEYISMLENHSIDHNSKYLFDFFH